MVVIHVSLVLDLEEADEEEQEQVEQAEQDTDDVTKPESDEEVGENGDKLENGATADLDIRMDDDDDSAKNG